MSDTFNWLHISDLHYGLAGQSPHLPEIKERFLEDLSRLHAKSGPWHAVFFTGDLVQSGQAAQFAGLKAAFFDAFWDRLRELGSGNALFYAVPGNHDLQRPVQKLKSPVVGKTPPPTSTALNLTKNYDLVRESFWAEETTDCHEMLAAAFQNYTAWWATAPGRPDLKHPAGFLPGDFAHTQEVAGRRIGILGLNSTALQLTGDDFYGKLAVDPVQTERLVGVGGLPAWVRGHHACILLTHQGPAWLSPTAQTGYAVINPAGRFAVHLFGHEHASVFSGQSWGGGQPRLVAQGHALFSKEPIQLPKTEERRHGYAAGRISFVGERGTIRFWPRKAFSDNVNGWRFAPDHESVARLEDDGGTPAAPITVLGPPPIKRDDSQSSAKATPAAQIDEIHARVVRKMTELFEKKPDLLAFLFKLFEVGTPQDKENAAYWLTLFIVENYEQAFRAVMEAELDRASAGDLDRFFRLMIPLSVAWEKGRAVRPVPEATPIRPGAHALTARLVSDCIAGRPYDRRETSRQIDSEVVEGPFPPEKLAGLRDQVRAKVRLEMFETLGETVDLTDADLVGALEERWKYAPDPFYVILAETQREMLELLGDDAILRHLIAFKRTPDARPLLKIQEGSFFTMVGIFLEKLKQAQDPSAKK